jgi:hypothetical protein
MMKELNEDWELQNIDEKNVLKCGEKVLGVVKEEIIAQRIINLHNKTVGTPQQRYYKKSANSGKCTRCKEEARPGLTTCQKCYDKLTEYRKNKQKVVDSESST